MTQREVELILVRQLASYLTIPIFVVDPAGTLIFFNEPAEALIARRFEETEELPLEEWTAMLQPGAEDGKPLPHDERPLVIALEQRRPTHNTLWITNQTGERLLIEVTAFPIVGQAGRNLGAVALFWGAEP
jgi:PAS domain-containing protein